MTKITRYVANAAACSLRQMGLSARKSSMNIYIVCDNHKIAQFPQHAVDRSWKHPICDTFDKAQGYCERWLGYNFRSATPQSPNIPIDYSGYGDFIEIVKIGE
jgi:hypothetical protein